MSASDPVDQTVYSVTLPAIEAILHTELLAHLDTFLRSEAHHATVMAELRAYADEHRTNAGYLVDALSIAAVRMRRLTGGIDRDEAAYAAIADVIDDDER